MKKLGTANSNFSAISNGLNLRIQKCDVITTENEETFMGEWVYAAGTFGTGAGNIHSDNEAVCLNLKNLQRCHEDYLRERPLSCWLVFPEDCNSVSRIECDMLRSGKPVFGRNAMEFKIEWAPVLPEKTIRCRFYLLFLIQPRGFVPPGFFYCGWMERTISPQKPLYFKCWIRKLTE